jgi:hypothetical protein
MEDGSSIKKTPEEEKEDRELAEKVNATLAEEEEEKKRLEEKKKRTEDEACPPVNNTCPIVEPCPTDKECLSCEDCRPCEDCKPCKECGQCPEVKPCKPCAVANNTSPNEDCPVPPMCAESPGLTLPAAMAVGAVTGILVTGFAATLGLVLRYVPPIASGFLFLATIIIVWYLCSQYPETARELGGRAATLLREAAVALGHRVMAAVQRHQEQVSVPTKSKLFFRMSSMFHFEVCTKIFYVEKINF